MRNYLKEFPNSILSLDRYSKRSIVIIIDACLCILCVWLAFVIRLDELILLKNFNYISALISIVIALPVFWIFGLYRTIFRYTDLTVIFSVFSAILVYGLIFFLIVAAYGLSGVPRSIGILQPLLLFFGIISSRLGAKFILTKGIADKNNFFKKNVIVYGAGNAGRQLTISLENSPEFEVLGFVDDNQQLHKQLLFGKQIYSPINLEYIVNTKNISLVFLALPAISRAKRNSIIENLNKYKLIVKTLPSISEIVDGRITVSDIKDLNIDDLLNRDEVKPDYSLLNKNIDSKTILVTGAGGSIGSDLCRQIIRLNPKKLILLELNEFSLYKIYNEISNINKNLKIIPLLVNAQDQPKLEKIFDTFQVDTIYHAAAYKHVPLVEENICEGVKNNVFSTLAISKAAVLKKVSSLVLVSSDKAVSPTNIMGASKRIAELCMQGFYNSIKEKHTQFSIVRFGNVLESSGSVIPKFKKQIKEGGPITLTHKDVTRYFMTITEASQLVIQAGAMGKHSEVFILDMGESFKIIDLIYKMVSLSGLTVKDEKNPNGDIEIEIIGLRPGEKLYEELLIGDNPQKTSHPKIQMIEDPYIPFDQLKKNLDNLKILINDNDTKGVKDHIIKLLKTYKSSSEIVDHFYVEQNLLKKSQNDLIHSNIK